MQWGNMRFDQYSTSWAMRSLLAGRLFNNIQDHPHLLKKTLCIELSYPGRVQDIVSWPTVSRTFHAFRWGRETALRTHGRLENRAVRNIRDRPP